MLLVMQVVAVKNRVSLYGSISENVWIVKTTMI